MFYLLDLGKSEQLIAKQAIRSGNPLPDRIACAPELQPYLEIYLIAFLDLDSERSHAFGLTSIPWSSIIKYAEYYEFDEEDTEELLYFIRKMDDAHLNRLDSKQKSNKKQPKKPRKKR